jgi:hypothetical protein
MKNENEFESILYKDNERPFLFLIEELDIQLPKLYYQDSYEIIIKIKGTFTITCLNYPKIKATIFFVGNQCFIILILILDSEY